MLRSSQNDSAAAYAVRSTLSDAELAQARTAFVETDRDGSGAIERSELARMLKSLGQTPTKRMVEEIFIASDGGADANGNGKIELREFLNWYSKQLQKKNQTAQDDVRRAAWACACTQLHVFVYAHAHSVVVNSAMRKWHTQVANVYRALGGVPALDLDKGELDGGDHGSPAVREQKTISKPELQARESVSQNGQARYLEAKVG